MQQRVMPVTEPQIRPEAGDWLAHALQSVAARVAARDDLSADALQMSNRRVSL
jgi:hypothetical protein